MELLVEREHKNEAIQTLVVSMSQEETKKSFKSISFYLKI